MKRTWRSRGVGAVALLAAAAGCGDDTTETSGSGGAGTTGSTSSVASTGVGSTGVGSTSNASTSTPASSGSSSDGGGGSGDGGSTSDGGGGSTSDGGGGSAADGGGGTGQGGAGQGGAGQGGAGQGGAGQGGAGQGGEGGGLPLPASWFCSAIWWDAEDGCDCECGAYDPDCDDDTQRIFRCGPVHDVGDGRACLPTGICEISEDWACADDAYADGTTCDCACGDIDYDCRLPDPLPVEGCDDGQSCSDVGECSDVPVSWTCGELEYADGLFCDCECGAYDPDCDTALIVNNCDLPDQTCGLDGTCAAPSDWTCDPDAWDDGTTCDCLCGNVDPDCSIPGAPVPACDAGEICPADACVVRAPNDACADAIPLVEGTVNGTWVGSTNDLDPGEDGCTDFSEVGGDVFYSVSLLDGQTLTVEIDQVGSAADSALYLVSDCSDADSCVAGVDTVPGQPEVLTYTATANVDLFLVVDQFFNTDPVDFELNVSID